MTVCVNRTPVTGEIEAARDKRDIDAFGCGLAHTIAQAPKEAQFDIWLNITTPYMPITSDGKAPDLKPFLGEICNAVGKAVQQGAPPECQGQARRRTSCSTISTPSSRTSAATASTGSTSGSCSTRSARSSWTRLDEELKIGNFKTIITDYEASTAKSRGMYREPRGIDLPSAPRRDDHARHADGRGLRAPGVDLQQGGLHREGRLQRGAQGRALGASATIAC